MFWFSPGKTLQSTHKSNADWSFVVVEPEQARLGVGQLVFLFSLGKTLQSRQKSNADCSFVCRAADKVIDRPAGIFVLSWQRRRKSNVDRSFEVLDQRQLAGSFYQMLTVVISGPAMLLFPQVLTEALKCWIRRQQPVGSEALLLLCYQTVSGGSCFSWSKPPNI